MSDTNMIPIGYGHSGPVLKILGPGAEENFGPGLETFFGPFIYTSVVEMVLMVNYMPV